MVSFTKQERLVIFILVGVIFTGSLGNFLIKKFPPLTGAVSLLESDKLYPRVDINSADFDELVAIPYIGEYTAEQIIAFREKHGPFTSIDEIKGVPGIKERNYEKFVKFIKVSSKQTQKNKGAD